MSKQATPGRQNREDIVRLEKALKVYQMGDQEVRALAGVDVSFHKGDFWAIMGPSGSGKSTMMNVLGCLDRLTSGAYFLEHQDVSQLDDDSLSELRLKHLGFIFQSFNLLPKLTVEGNVELPLIYGNVGARERKQRVHEVLEHLGLWERRHHKPNEISGGQKQRVAIARALIKEPTLILADEPTGNLDSTTTGEIMALLDSLNKEGNTIVVITHEPDVAEHAGRLIKLKDGQIVEE